VAPSGCIRRIFISDKHVIACAGNKAFGPPVIRDGELARNVAVGRKGNTLRVPASFIDFFL